MRSPQKMQKKPATTTKTSSLQKDKKDRLAKTLRHNLQRRKASPSNSK